MKIASDPQSWAKFRRKAEEAWLELLQGDRPLICTGMSTCGISAQAADVQAAMEQELKAQGIDAKSMSV
ncbi:MAG TPA: hypothetical protein PKV83_02675, partial [Methanothrix sp.]|nr:hypothetical protein [Methanothrix sp.]